MKLLKLTYHFLGSFYFAIIIIAMMAIIVTVGTFTESYTDSHQYAALFTYNNPVFIGILFALFINILFSALRRWPFKTTHIPFLITHLGLLMLISGVIVKNLWGVQGHMSLAEGGSSRTLIIPHTEVVRVEKRDPKNPTRIISSEFPITSRLWKNERRVSDGRSVEFPEFSLELVGYCPHCEESWDTWIKKGMGTIAGLEPFPVYKMSNEESAIPISTKVKIFRDVDEVWDIYAVETESPELALELITQDTPLIEKDIFSSHRPQSSLVTPKIIFLKTDEDEVIVHAIDRYGHINTHNYRSTEITPLVVYNEGFGGYFATITIPFPAYPYDSLTVDQAKIHRVVKHLRRQDIATGELSPPLQLLKRACQKTNSDFAYTLAKIYEGKITPDISHTLDKLEWSLLPQDQVTVCYWAAIASDDLQNHSKDKVPTPVIQKLVNSNSLLSELKKNLRELPPYDYISKHSLALNADMFQNALTLYGIDLNFLCPNLSPEETQQCLIEFLEDNTKESQLAEAFPPLKTLSFQQKASVLKELSRNHLTINQLITTKNPEDTLPTFSRPDLWDQLENKLRHHEITFETPISPVYPSLPPTNKLEENRPKVTLFAREGNNKQFISLAYDPTGERLKWPILNGEYRVSFQPKTVELPVEIRLHDARQVNYPNTNQPLSFEADIFTSKSDDDMVTISMNNVYESDDGYRFYLSNISPGDESAVQNVQLVVNFDPAKHLLTYPGGILIAIGTLLLFWFRPKFHGSKSISN